MGDPTELLGKSWTYRVHIGKLQGLGFLAKRAYVQYSIFGEVSCCRCCVLVGRVHILVVTHAHAPRWLVALDSSRKVFTTDTIEHDADSTARAGSRPNATVDFKCVGRWLVGALVGRCFGWVDHFGFAARALRQQNFVVAGALLEARTALT